jgi:hypothetical protein
MRLPAIPNTQPLPNSATLSSMLFMVIERFKQGDPKSVGNRFKTLGRMLPEDVTYQASWMEPTGGRCFQIMEAPSLDALNVWVCRWSDLVAFEIIPVITSAEFWADLPND